MSIYGQTKGTELEKQIAQLATGEAMGGMMYYAMARFAAAQKPLLRSNREEIKYA